MNKSKLLILGVLSLFTASGFNTASSGFVVPIKNVIGIDGVDRTFYDLSGIIPKEITSTQLLGDTTNLNNISYNETKGIFSYYVKSFISVSGSSEYWNCDTGFNIIQNDNFFKPGCEYYLRLYCPYGKDVLSLTTEGSKYITDYSSNYYLDIYSEDSESYEDIKFKVTNTVPDSTLLFTYSIYNGTSENSSGSNNIQNATNIVTLLNNAVYRYNDEFVGDDRNYTLLDNLYYVVVDDEEYNENVVIPAVVKDLQDYGLENLDSYTNGLVTGCKMLTLLESQNSEVFIYVYRDFEEMEYNKIDLSTNTNVNSNDSFKSYTLAKITETPYLVKYLIVGLAADLNASQRRYAVRQVYNEQTKDKIDTIIPVALEYIIGKDNSGTYYSQTNSIESIIITDKLVAFELNHSNIPLDQRVYNDMVSKFATMGVSNAPQLDRQSNYIAFSTNIKIDDLVGIELSYDYSIYDGISTIGWQLGTSKEKFINNFNGSDSFGDVNLIGSHNNNYELIEPGTIEVQKESSFLWWHKKAYSYETIAKPSEIERPSKAISNYDWVVRFCENDLMHQNVMHGTNWKYDFVNYYDVTNVSVFQLYHNVEGAVKKLLVVDTYQDSEGNIPVTKDLSIWEKMIRAWQRLFDGTFEILDDTPYLILSIVLVLGGLLILGILIKFFKILFMLFK